MSFDVSLSASSCINVVGQPSIHIYVEYRIKYDADHITITKKLEPFL